MSVNETVIPGIPDLGTRDDTITIYAGPCSVESEEQIVGVARVTISRQLAELAGEGFLRTVNRRLQVNREQYHQYIGEKGKALTSSLP